MGIAPPPGSFSAQERSESAAVNIKSSKCNTSRPCGTAGESALTPAAGLCAGPFLFHLSTCSGFTGLSLAPHPPPCHLPVQTTPYRESIYHTMSDSEEDIVRHPGRTTEASHVHSPSESERGNTPEAVNGGAGSPLGSDAGQLNGDNDDDLFGSASEPEPEPEPEPEREKYSYFLFPKY